MLARDIRWIVFPAVFLSLVSSQAICQDRITSSEMDEIQRRYTRTEDLAKKGDAKAQFDLGVWYESEIPSNEVEALNWYRKSAEQGFAPAQYKVGYAYAIGQGVPHDDTEAAKWYRKAADQGHALAQLNLGTAYNKGLGLPRDDAEAEKWYRRSAENGEPLAQGRLGNMYLNGLGVKQSNVEAAKWFLMAAEHGNENAQYILGMMYLEGMGVTQNDAEAVKWFRKAASQGHAAAQFNLGYAYENGRSVSKNDAEAVKWYRMAAEQGNEEAVATLARKSPGTILFGIPLKNASRKDLRAAIKKQGAKVKSEDNNKWGDSYASEAILSGSTVLSVTYANDDRFAGASYTFPGIMDSQLVVKVKEMVESKYGTPGESSGNPGLGAVSYGWKLKDGIRISVSRGWPDTTTYLEYTDPKNYKTMKAEMEVQQQKKEAQKYRAQDKVY